MSETVRTVVEQEIVVGVFTHIAQSRYNVPVIVELIEGAGDGPAVGTLAWDAECASWRVLVRSELRRLDLFRVLLHELAHIIHLDAPQVPTSEPALDGMRDRLAGRRTAAAAEIDAGSRERYKHDLSWWQEAAADAFAEMVAVDTWAHVLEALRKIEMEK